MNGIRDRAVVRMTDRVIQGDDEQGQFLEKFVGNISDEKKQAIHCYSQEV